MAEGLFSWFSRSRTNEQPQALSQLELRAKLDELTQRIEGCLANNIETIRRAKKRIEGEGPRQYSYDMNIAVEVPEFSELWKEVRPILGRVNSAYTTTDDALSSVIGEWFAGQFTDVDHAIGRGTRVDWYYERDDE